MKKMRIVIKCEGLTLRTNDLGMGLTILKRIAEDGIMKHTWVPNFLLEKASSVIDAATQGQIMAKSLINRVKEGFKLPEFAPTEGEEVTTEEPKQLPGKKKRRAGIKQMLWTVEEDKLLCDLVDKKPSQIAKRRGLQRHTKHAIKTRLSIYRNKRFDRLNQDRANVMRAYISGEQVTTPVVDINKNVSTPVVDAMEKKVMNQIDAGNKISATKKGIVTERWTEREKQILRDNPTTKIKKLATMLIGRSEAAITYKRRRVLGVIDAHGNTVKPTRKTVKNRKPMVKWTEEELDAVRLNIDMKPKELAELPWLKDRNIKQIAQKKWELKSKS